MLKQMFADFGIPALLALYVAIGMIVLALLIVALFRYKKLRDHINRRIIPMEVAVAAQNAVYLLSKKKNDGGGFGFSFSTLWLDKLIARSGKDIRTNRFLALMAIIFIGILAIAVSMGLTLSIALPVAVVFGLGGPLKILKMMGARRLKKFGIQFTEAVELIVRSLKAGHPVPAAIRMVSTELANPIAGEFAMISDEINYGSDLVTAIKSMQARVANEDLPLFVTAISIQSTTGGNLGQILEGLASVLRQRIKLRRKVKAAAAEGKASAMILNAVPLLVLGFVTIMTPDYYGAIIHEPFIIIGLAGAFGWLSLGNFVMYRMINFKV